MAGSLGGVSAHWLMIPSEGWGDPAAGLSAPPFRADGDSVSRRRTCHALARTDGAGRLAAATSTGQLHGRLLERSAASGGEMLLLLAVLRARDAAVRRAVGGDPDKP